MIQLAFYLLLFFGVIVLIRFLGSWMLRIDEVIKELKEVNKTLKKNSTNEDSGI